MKKISERFENNQKNKSKNIFTSFFGDLFRKSNDSKKDSFFNLFKDLFVGKTDNFFGRLFNIFKNKENIISNTKRETRNLRYSLVGGVESMVSKKKPVAKETKGKKKFEKSPENERGGIQAILALIRKIEGNNNYNAVYGNPNQSVIDFTNMTIEDILSWQDKHKKAVGAYQFKRYTLRDLCKANHISLNKKFTPDMQDRLAILRMEYRGLNEFREGKIGIDKFQKRLSQEWAALPKDESGESFYKGVGNNRALVSSSKIREHLEALV